MRRRTFLRSGLLASGALTLRPPFGRTLGSQALNVRQARDVVAVTGNGREVTLTSRAIAALAARVRGHVLLASDSGFEQARRIYNPSFDKRPALIVQATGVADIRAAVDFARDNGGLLLAVKGGGHSFSGKSTCDRGMMIDLTGFRAVRVDPAARRAWATGGSLLGAVDHETLQFDLATPLGTVSDTGAGGLITGGGFGRLSRHFGLAIDNLIAADVVTADGVLRHASAQENPDLFWGVRGGGGNFGIVTTFELGLHPMPRKVIGGKLAFPFAKARDALNLYADYAPRAPEELGIILDLQKARSGDGGVVFDLCYSGPPSGAERALAPLRRLGTPMSDDVRSADYYDLQRSGDDPQPQLHELYIKSGFISSLPTGLIDALLEGLTSNPRRDTFVFLETHGGAISRVAPDATALPHRRTLASLAAGAFWDHGEPTTEHASAIQRYWSTLESFTDGFYVNYMEAERAQAAVRTTYKGNLPRLMTIKKKYDPTNLFRLNANVEPGA